MTWSAVKLKCFRTLQLLVTGNIVVILARGHTHTHTPSCLSFIPVLSSRQGFPELLNVDVSSKPYTLCFMDKWKNFLKERGTLLADTHVYPLRYITNKSHCLAIGETCLWVYLWGFPEIPVEKGWRNGSVLRNAYCSHKGRGTGFVSSLTWWLMIICNPVQKDWMTSCNLHGPFISGWTYILSG